MTNKVRPVQPSDLDEVSQWFSSVKWPLPAVRGSIPEGLMLVSSEGVPVAVVFAHTTGTSAMFCHWMAAKPELSEDEQLAALRELLTAIQQMAPSINPPVQMIQVVSASPSAPKLLEPLGFNVKQSYYVGTWIADSELERLSKKTGR